MSREVIVWYPDTDGSVWGEECEEIVRCRDCKHYHGEFKGCDEFGDESRGVYAHVGPGGFCAWAERRASA